MRPLSRIGLALLALVASLLPACSQKNSATAPIAHLPPKVVATSPPARSLGTPYDQEIWAQFDRPLVPSSVDSTTVFLKIDTKRIPMNVSYEAITRRIRVQPRSPLDLQRTYTVELSPRITSADGGTLGSTYFWQFITNSLRRLRYDYPAVESVQGPVSAIGWSGNGPPVSNLYYDVFASVDSVAVMNRTIPSLSHAPFVTFTPPLHWPLGARVYFAVDVSNLDTNERLQGVMSHYLILPASTPIDSFDVGLQDYGGVQQPRPTTQLCTSANFLTGPNYNAAARWAISGTQPDLYVADVSIVLWLNPGSAGQVDFGHPSIWSVQNNWNACTMTYPGPPYANTNGQLAAAHSLVDPLATVFRSDTLSGFVEQMARRNSGLGFIFKSVNLLSFVGPAGSPTSRFTVRYYRWPATPTAAARRR